MEPVDIVLTRDTFEVLASETRLDILKTLSPRRMTVTELADSFSFNLAKSTVHHHLQRLADAGLVAAGEDGRTWVYYALTPEGPPMELLVAGIALAMIGGVPTAEDFSVDEGVT